MNSILTHSKVPKGDARVPSSENPEDPDSWLVVDGLTFGEIVKASIESSSPNKQLSRNAQCFFDEWMKYMTNRVFDFLKTQSLILSSSNMISGVKNVLSKVDQLLNYALKEIEKDDEGSFFEVLKAYIPENFPEFCDQMDSDDWISGVKKCSLFLDYFLSEAMELSSNCASDCHLKAINVSHIMTAFLDDEDLLEISKPITLGHCLPCKVNIIPFQLSYDKRVGPHMELLLAFKHAQFQKPSYSRRKKNTLCLKEDDYSASCDKVHNTIILYYNI